MKRPRLQEVRHAFAHDSPPLFAGASLKPRIREAVAVVHADSPPLFAGASLKHFFSLSLCVAGLIPPRFSRGPH